MRTEFHIGAFAAALAVSSSAFAGPTLYRQERKVGAFDRVQVGSAFDLVVTNDSAPLVVRAEKKLLAKIQTRVHGSTLSIDWKPSWGWSNHPRVVVSVGCRRLVGISASGAARVKAVCGTAAPVKVEASGASKVAATGLATESRVLLSGAAKANLDFPKAKRIDANASGASELSWSQAATDAKVQVSGAGKVLLLKGAGSLAVMGSGAGQITCPTASSAKGSLSGAAKLLMTSRPQTMSVSTSGGASVQAG